MIIMGVTRFHEAQSDGSDKHRGLRAADDALRLPHPRRSRGAMQARRDDHGAIIGVVGQPVTGGWPSWRRRRREIDTELRGDFERLGGRMGAKIGSSR